MHITAQNLDNLAWDKMDGLLPCIVQDAFSGRMLMQGYVNREAVAATLNDKQVTFFSRSKQRLWRKGEESGHTLDLVELIADCDQDSILALAHPNGPTCHTGSECCWRPTQQPVISQLSELQRTVDARKAEGNESQSYTAKLLADGIRRCAQKVGEEGVEVALAAVAQNDDALLNESADLLYHLMVVLSARDLSIADVCHVLEQRKK
ncbi:MAG: bifunctional phosphoribosyl-AMP cyclohydrolase/phosphoribosyl-ATP diphosphatase [Idiomarina sp.]|nr:bifunctional phosphoribosyl-AMP cyclohydrolase/phosphoribosyl-ATP diphosphatase [Idiomarina sp.]